MRDEPVKLDAETLATLDAEVSLSSDPAFLLGAPSSRQVGNRDALQQYIQSPCTKVRLAVGLRRPHRHVHAISVCVAAETACPQPGRHR